LLFALTDPAAWRDRWRIMIPVYIMVEISYIIQVFMLYKGGQGAFFSGGI